MKTMVSKTHISGLSPYPGAGLDYAEDLLLPYELESGTQARTPSYAPGEWDKTGAEKPCVLPLQAEKKLVLPATVEAGVFALPPQLVVPHFAQGVAHLPQVAGEVGVAGANLRLEVA